MKTSLLSKGFTIAEITLVVAITGVIIAVAVPAFLRARENFRTRACSEYLCKICRSKQQVAVEAKLVECDPLAMGDLLETRETGYQKARPESHANDSKLSNADDTEPGLKFEGSEIVSNRVVQHVIPGVAGRAETVPAPVP